MKNEVVFEATLARGLTYYTGCIFEVITDKVSIGSICGGGRYADLTSIFGLKDVSGVGISFGAERIYDVMEELNLWPEDIDQRLDILLMAMDPEAHFQAFRWLTILRAHNITADLYPEPKKFRKQMKYAGDIGVKWVGIIGSDEIARQEISLKNMETGEQESLPLDAILDRFA